LSFWIFFLVIVLSVLLRFTDSVALFTKILTIKNCRKCKTKIKKSFTKILTIILSVKTVLTLRVKLLCPKCKILILREKKRKKRWTMYWRFDLKIREQFIVSAFSMTVCQAYLHILINVYWNVYGLIQTDDTNGIVVYSFLAWLITKSVYNDAFRTFTFSMQQCIVYMTKKSG
jgi:hypothetical protein